MESLQETHAPPTNNTSNPQGGWARSLIEKTNLFAKHLSEVFKPHSSIAAADVTEYLHTPFQMSPPIEPFTSAEIIEAISRLNSKKAVGNDLIGNKASRNFP